MMAFLFPGGLTLILVWLSLAHAGSPALAELIMVHTSWTRASPGLGWSEEQREGFPSPSPRHRA